MRTILIFIFLLYSSISISCSEIEDRYIPKGSKSKTQLLCRRDYELLYSYDMKLAVWSGQTLTKSEVNKIADRINAFREDESIPLKYRAQLRDYVGSNFDRGHLTPAANMSSIQGMLDSFLLSNIAPQSPSFNRGIWRTVESRIREKVKREGKLIIFSGPIVAKQPIRIGVNKIPVPRAFFKIVYNPNKNESLSFIIPNEKISSKLIDKYIVKLSDIKKETGLKFFPSLHKISELTKF